MAGRGAAAADRRGTGRQRLEALQNAVRHATGSAVRVSLAEDGADVAFTIADDGPGFDPATAPTGSGLRNMNDRLAALGGSCQADSSPGRGTTVTGRIGTGPPVAGNSDDAPAGPAGDAPAAGNGGEVPVAGRMG